jgi:hypothetical protein
MSQHRSTKGILAILLSVSGLLAQVPAKLNTKALSLPTSTVPGFKIPAKSLAKAHPPKLTDAQYVALRPHLASLLKLPEGSLAPRLLQAGNLVSPGATVNVVVGQTPPSGFHWQAISSSNTGPGYSESLGNGAIVIFWADNVAPGTYLMTVYLETNAATMQGWAGSLAVTAAVQNKMINVPFVKSTPPNIPLDIGVLFPNTAGGTGIYSCDFMRIR